MDEYLVEASFDSRKQFSPNSGHRYCELHRHELLNLPQKNYAKYHRDVLLALLNLPRFPQHLEQTVPGTFARTIAEHSHRKYRLDQCCQSKNQTYF